MAYGLPPVGPVRRPAMASRLAMPNYGARPPAPTVAQPQGASQVGMRPNITGSRFGLPGNFSATNASRDILQQGIGAGALTPQYLQRIARRRAYANYLNTRRRGRNASSLYAYGDPYAARSAATNADIEASRGLGQELTNADLSAYGSYADRIASLLSNQTGYEQAAAQRKAEQDAANKGFWGDVAGTVVGTAAHFIPGYH